MTPKMRGNLVLGLPKRIRERLQYHYLQSLSKKGDPVVDHDEPAFSQAIIKSPDINVLVSKAIRDIVARPALTQSVKGILTAGPAKSYTYACSKLTKSFKARS